MRFGPIFTGVTLVALTALTGCMSSPTYGTGKTANAQLMEDIGSSIQITPKRREKIDYNPRPDVLKTTTVAGLPQPQQNVTKQDGVWPESPEQKRARLRQIATDAQGDATFEPTIYDDTLPRVESAPEFGPNRDRDARKRQTADTSKIKELRKVNAAGSPTTRKHLSEPPLEYRAPVAGAEYGDLGEDESKKERRLRAEAKKAKGKKQLRDYVPWL